MVSDDPDTRSLAESREKRTRKATVRGAERDAELERLRKAREAKRIREQVAAETQTHPQDASRGVELIFSAAEPTLTGDPEIDKANQVMHKAHTLIKVLAHRTSIDYTNDYKQGKITLTELEDLLKGEPACLEPTAKGKEKAAATPVRPDEYPGIIFGKSPQTVLSKHNATTRYGSVPAESSPSKPTSRNKHPLDSEDTNEASKTRRVHEGVTPRVPAGTSASQPLGPTYPPLKRTDNTTIIFGKRLPNPQSMESNVRVAPPSVPLTRPRPTNAFASPGYADDNVPSPKSRPAASQPQHGQQSKPVGTIRVPVPHLVPPSRPAQPQPADRSGQSKSKHPPSSKCTLTRPGPTVSGTHGSRSSTSDGAGATLPRPPASHVSKTTHRKPATQATTSAEPRPVPPAIPPRPKGKTLGDPTRRSVSASASSHSRDGLVAVNNSNISANASGRAIVHSVNARQRITGGSKSSTVQVNPRPIAPGIRVNAGRAPPPANAGSHRQASSPENTRNDIPNPAPVPPPNTGDAEAHAPAQREVTGRGSVQPMPITGFYQTKPLNPNKPALVMFEPDVQDLLKLAEVRARGEVIANGTYDYSADDPGDVVRSHDEIIASAWRWACKQRRVKKPYLAVYGKYVDSLITSYRGQTKGDVKKILDAQFNFNEDNPEGNIETYNKILPNGFFYGDPNKMLHPFENPFLAKACREAVFVGLKPWAIKFPKLFNPLPPRFIAFILAIGNHVINGYRDGVYNTEDRLCVPTQTQAFRKYLKRLMDMRRERPVAYQSLFTQMYDDCRTQAERNKAPLPPSPSPPREWSPDIDEGYVSKYAAPLSDESDVELAADAGDLSDLADPGPKPESEPEPEDTYRDDDDLEDEDLGLASRDGASCSHHVDGASGSHSSDSNQVHAGPSRLALQLEHEQEPSDQEMAEYPDEGERELNDDELTDN